MSNFELRSHQRELKNKLFGIAKSDTIYITAWVVPGGGKSHLPVIVHERFPKCRIYWFVPRLSLMKQAARSAQKQGVVLLEADNREEVLKAPHGCVITHQSLCSNPDLWVDAIRTGPSIVVIDEPHHAKVNRDGTYEALATAVSKLKACSPRVWMDMSGTMETSDNTLIYGREYEETPSGYEIKPERGCDIYIRYDRLTAKEERAIVPVEFYFHDGPVQWAKDGTIQHEQRLSDVERSDEGAAIFTALKTNVAAELFEQSLTSFRKCGNKIIVVTARQAEAKHYADKLRGIGLRTALAIDDNDRARDEIDEFVDRGQAMVTCQMAYEGLDAPPTTHIACLTHIRSAPWIEQMLGRAWRWYPGKSRCFAFVPDDPRMRRVIERIKSEEPSSVGYEGEGRDGPPQSTVIAVGGTVDFIRRAFLDECPVNPEELKSKLAEFYEGMGIVVDEAFIQKQVEELLATEVTLSSSTETYKDQLMRLRREYNKRNVTYSLQQGWAAGELNRRLYAVFGKSATAMNIEELARAMHYANTHYPLG